MLFVTIEARSRRIHAQLEMMRYYVVIALRCGTVQVTTLHSHCDLLFAVLSQIWLSLGCRQVSDDVLPIKTCKLVSSQTASLPVKQHKRLLLLHVITPSLPQRQVRKQLVQSRLSLYYSQKTSQAFDLNVQPNVSSLHIVSIQRYQCLKLGLERDKLVNHRSVSQVAPNYTRLYQRITQTVISITDSCPRHPESLGVQYVSRQATAFSLDEHRQRAVLVVIHCYQGQRSTRRPRTQVKGKHRDRMAI